MLYPGKVISKECITKKETDEFTKATLHGDVDQVLHVKKPVEMEVMIVEIEMMLGGTHIHTHTTASMQTLQKQTGMGK